MREVIYCAERDFLERYLKERASTTLEDFKAISDMYGNPIAIHGPGSNEAVNEIYRVEGDTAYIKIKGPLSPDGPDLWDRFWGYDGTSYITIQAAMERAKNESMVARVVFKIDSPGGTLFGCDETWQAHKALAAEKPTEVHAAYLASAAYWISTPAEKILAVSPASEIGSIGVLVATYDWSGYEERLGIREVVITSSHAENKRPDISTEHGRNTVKAQLDAIERIFYSRIAECRGYDAKYIAEHFGRGGTMVAADPDLEKDDAVRVGMIDDMIDGGYIIGKPYPGPKLTCEEKKELSCAYEEAIKPGAKFFAADEKELSKEECEEIRQQLISLEEPSGEEKNTPALAGTGGSAMLSLQELLAQNPTAKAEVDALIAKAKEEAKAEYSARVEKVMPIIQSTAYPANIKTIACNVLSGKEEMAAFTATVAVFDCKTEAEKSASAQGHTADIGPVGAEAPDGKTPEQKTMEAAGKSAIEQAKAQKEAVGKWL